MKRGGIKAPRTLIKAFQANMSTFFGSFAPLSTTMTIKIGKIPTNYSQPDFF
jgi:hypothetical protein